MPINITENSLDEKTVDTDTFFTAVFEQHFKYFALRKISFKKTRKWTLSILIMQPQHL